MRKGRKATGAKRYQEALASFAEALAAKPNDSRALGERGSAWLLRARTSTPRCATSISRPAGPSVRRSFEAQQVMHTSGGEKAVATMQAAIIALERASATRGG